MKRRKKKHAADHAGVPMRSRAMEIAMELTDFSAEATDPMGSYTGRPEDPNEVPVQDADDL